MNIIYLLRNIYNNIIDFIIPPVCSFCDLCVGAQGEICKECSQKLDFITIYKCGKCGYPFMKKSNKDNLDKIVIEDACQECTDNLPYFCKIRSVCIYNKYVKSIIKNLKYHDRMDVVTDIGIMLYKNYINYFDGKIDIVTNPPMDSSSLSKRMYNQAAIIAKQLLYNIKSDKTRGAKIPYFIPDLVKKIKHTTKQTYLTREQRLKNLDSSMIVDCQKGFPFSKESKFTVLVVDDIITTGATVNEIARAIIDQYPNAKVNAISFARTPKETS